MNIDSIPTTRFQELLSLAEKKDSKNLDNIYFYCPENQDQPLYVSTSQKQGTQYAPKWWFVKQALKNYEKLSTREKSFLQHHVDRWEQQESTPSKRCASISASIFSLYHSIAKCTSRTSQRLKRISVPPLIAKCTSGAFHYARSSYSCSSRLMRWGSTSYFSTKDRLTELNKRISDDVKLHEALSQDQAEKFDPNAQQKMQELSSFKARKGLFIEEASIQTTKDNSHIGALLAVCHRSPIFAKICSSFLAEKGIHLEKIQKTDDLSILEDRLDFFQKSDQEYVDPAEFFEWILQQSKYSIHTESSRSPGRFHEKDFIPITLSK